MSDFLRSLVPDPVRGGGIWAALPPSARVLYEVVARSPSPKGLSDTSDCGNGLNCLTLDSFDTSDD